MQALKTWAADQAEEDAMDADHRHLWQQMITHINETDLSGKQLLDYGCNQGGFLRLLHQQKPFAKAVGVDLAAESLEVASARIKDEPLEFLPVTALEDYKNSFDMAFSHEVLYLLPDLDAHAALIAESLKSDVVYYAAMGCHADNPQWERGVEIISAYSTLLVQSYSLNDYADAFFNAGFSVSARPYQFDGFVPLKQDNQYFPSVRDSLDYHTTHKTLFRFEKP